MSVLERGRQDILSAFATSDVIDILFLFTYFRAVLLLLALGILGSNCGAGAIRDDGASDPALGGRSCQLWPGKIVRGRGTIELSRLPFQHFSPLEAKASTNITTKLHRVSESDKTTSQLGTE